MTSRKSQGTAIKRVRTPTRRKLETRETGFEHFEVRAAVKVNGYKVTRQVPPSVIVKTIRTGVSAYFIRQMAGDMAVPQESIYETLGLARATLARKAKEGKRMSPNETERALGLARLIGQVEEMVTRSGTAKGFDAARWTAEWLQQPNPSLDGKRPAEWMDPAVGRELVSETLARIESGVYA